MKKKQYGLLQFADTGLLIHSVSETPELYPRDLFLSKCYGKSVFF